MAEKTLKINEFLRGWGWFATVEQDTHKPNTGKASTPPCLGWQSLTSPQQCSVRTGASLTDFVRPQAKLAFVSILLALRRVRAGEEGDTYVLKEGCVSRDTIYERALWGTSNPK